MSARQGILRSIGPAIIVASVVLGPGSIVSNSKMGVQYGYDMVWVLAGTTILMIGMLALSARLGVFLDGSLCEELASRAGRPLAVLTGLTLFFVAASFQFGNNLGILFSIEPFLAGSSLEDSKVLPAVILVALNVGIAAFLFGLRHLYRPIERALKVMVAVMVVGFAANLFWAQPSLSSILTGFVPRLSRDAGAADPLTLLAVVGTTFSVGGAFYHAYLVRQKRWTRDHLRQGLIDSVVGMTTLGLLSLMIMVTAAAVLHGRENVDELKTAADVALQLKPLFGPWATGLFCVGIFAGAFSSFLVNAMLGGTVLSDGLGRGGSMDQTWPRLFTVLTLAVGMIVAIAIKSIGLNVGNLIIVAQAVTVLGNPLLAGAMLWLATRPDLTSQRAVPIWMKLLAGVSFVVVLLLSARTAWIIYGKLTAP